MDYDRYDSSDDGQRRRGRSPHQHQHHRPHRSGRDRDDRDHSYQDMYDEGYRGETGRRGRYDLDSQNGDHYAHPESRRGSSRSPLGGRHTSPSYSRTREAGKPTDTVILEGLPYSISTADLREGLLADSIAAEFPSFDLRLSSSRGNRRAFVQFDTVAQASAFVKEHFPKLLIELRHSTDDAPDGKLEAYIHYARNRDEGEARPPRAADWACPQCDFLNFSSRTKCKVCGGAQAAPPSWEQSLTGAADEADGVDAVSQILVVYPLPSFVTEDMLAKDLKLLEKSEEPKSSANGPTKLKSTAPGADASRYGARPNALHRVFLIREVNSGESFKYGFVEFWTLEDATAAVTKFRMSRSFTVAGCAVTIAPTHMGVFLPEERAPTGKNEHMSFHPLFNPSLRVRYRDLHVFPSQLVVNSEPPADVAQMAAKSGAEEQHADGKKQKKRKADASLATASAAKKPVAMAGQMAVWQRKHHELRGNNEGDDDANVSKPEFVPKSDANKAPIKISLSMSTKLGTGTGTPCGTANQAQPASSDGTLAKEAAVAAEGNITTAPAGGADSQSEERSNTGEETYMDKDRLMCLICMRKYKSTDEVRIHERSRNHKTAMEDEEKVKAALPRIAARDKRLEKQRADEPPTTQSTQYRDRAKERRDVYNQPDKPVVQGGKSKGESNNKPADQDAGKAGAKPAPPSRGAGMLAKMGWTSGSGLGANGDGRTEAIAPNAYQEGVGLGAQGGNLGDAVELAEKKTRNKYSDYLNTVQDKARERYNQMS